MTEKEIYVTPEMKIWTFEKITMDFSGGGPDVFENLEDSETDVFE